MHHRLKKYALAACLFLSLHITSPAHATIRDAEVEGVLQDFIAPLLRSANLPSENVNIFILNAPSINAFVAQGLNIFIHTGLIEAAETPEMLLAVLAHEIGHIEGAHLARLTQYQDTIQIGQILNNILGAVVLASGGGQAGGAILHGGGSFFQQNLLNYIRVNEQAADQAGLRYLKENNIPATGMLDLFKRLQREEQQSVGKDIPAYLRTHPLNAERIANVRRHLDDTSTAPPLSADMRQTYARMRAKLFAFLHEPETVLSRYNRTDLSPASRYARAIALFRKGRTQASVDLMKGLIRDEPENGYLYDTFGQILFESGYPNEALKLYQKASALQPNSPIILTDLARAHLQNDGTEAAKKAVNLLEHATSGDKSYSRAWRQLSIAYNRIGMLGESHLALAEEGALQSNADIIARETTLALGQLKENSTGYLRAKDLRKYALELENKKG